MSEDPGAARAGLPDLVRLGARLAKGKIGRRGRFDAGATMCRWARGMLDREGGEDVEIGLAGRSVRVVAARDRSDGILGSDPGTDGYRTGRPKRKGMAFLAPGALTIADGERWTRLRAFNEEVLAPGQPHPLAAEFLGRVRAAFREPVRIPEDVSAAMGRAMAGIVLGDLPAGQDPAGDVSAVFGAVKSPLKRKLLAFRYRKPRQRLYALLERCWEASDGSEPTLLGRARSVAPDLPRDELLQQVPHWMFTFTGSGSDLLTRTLAMVTARPDVHARAVEEISEAGEPDDPRTVERMAYLRACLLETGRLFPPVTRTFHQSPAAGSGDGRGRQLVHWFPLLQRDPELGASVHAFRPDRWEAPSPDPAAAASNLFLRGPRTCPGADLILFVARSALARLLGEIGMQVQPSRLSTDPLPVSFPAGEVHLQPLEES